MHPEQRVTLDIGMLGPSKELIAAVANLRDSSKFSIRTDKNNAAALEAIPKLGINWYFTNAAMTYDDIYTYKILGASEFFIGAQLGFDLPHCKAIADDLNMKVRSIYAYRAEDNPYIEVIGNTLFAQKMYHYMANILTLLNFMANLI